MEKITGPKAVIWAVTILIGIGGVVYGAMMRERAHTYEGYKESLAAEMRNHREDLASCAERDKTCAERARIDCKTIKELTDQRDRLARKIKVGKGATVNITVAP